MADSQTAKRTPLANDPVGAIVGEFIEEKRREIDEEKARRAKRRSPIIVPLLIVLSVGVWMAPSFLPAGQPAVSAETFEEGARLNLYLASLRIRQYQATNNVLPTDLRQAGVDTTAMTYTTLANGSEFQLSTNAPSGEIVYRSTQPDSVLLRSVRLRGIR